MQQSVMFCFAYEQKKIHENKCGYIARLDKKAKPKMIFMTTYSTCTHDFFLQLLHILGDK